ncbi:hypothetical protein DVK02_00630 [Halobellus sp. Atlit-31R]|nr:hypothetical protein DVK02_00630 [Halobellus sp. Atlit-31R]
MTFDADPGFVDRAPADGDGGAVGDDPDDDPSNGLADPPNAQGTDAGDGDETTARIRSALDEVRREVRKAALLYATVDAALLALLSNLALALVEPPWLATTVGLPAAVVGLFRQLPVLGGVAPATIQATSLAAVALGVAAFVGEAAVRLRRPLVEQFEAANPPVREALRTARDAVDDGADTAMARRLYDDVIATLGETSTFELVGTRRVAVTVLLVALVSLASVQVAIVDPDVGGLFGPNGDGDGQLTPPADDDLQDGDQILGDPEDVEAGDELQNISVPGSGDGIGDGPTGPSSGYPGGGGSGEFDSRQAGFTGAAEIEDAELVREYNLRIREFDDETET